QDGTYTVAVFNTRGEVGKYVLAIGEREQFGWRDLLDFPRTHATVREWTVAPLATAVPSARPDLE
ncbi:MAG: hypothetical protein LC737_00715, partial [Chloroflexi bacterium]|nr:hypothetical protein [Chloroflexota bacterium]